MKVIFGLVAVFAIIALHAGIVNETPYVFIPEIKTAPVLDGNLDDGCWKNAVRLAPFMSLNSEKQALNQTEVYLAHDDANLYVAARCHSKILDSTLQMLDKFKAEKKERDSSVFSDDSVEIFIAPDKKEYFHFAVNALGTLYEGKGQENSWNSTARTAASIKEKLWEVEIAIPLKDLNLSSAKYFMINLCRNEKADNEYSSWALLSSGFHCPEKFGKAMIGKTGTVQIVSEKLPVSPVSTGELKYKFNVANSLENAKELKLDLIFIKNEKAEFKRAEKNVASRENALFEINYDILKSGDYKYQFLLTDKKDGSLVYRSPLYSLKSKVLLTASNEISYTGKCNILLNGKDLKNKNLNLEEENIITVECEGPGTLSGGIVISDKDKSLPEMVAFSGEVKARERKIFTQKILVKNTEIFPIDVSKGLNIAEGTVQQVPFVLKSPENKTLEILLPEGMEFIDFKGEASAESIDGVSFRKYIFKYNETKKVEKFVLGSVMKINTVSSGKTFYFRTKGPEMLEAWNRVPVNVLPPLLNKHPLKLRTELWHAFGMGEYNDNQINAVLATYCNAGFNGYSERTLCYGNRKFADVALKNNMTLSSDFNFRYQFATIAQSYPDARARNIEGKQPHYLKLKPSFIYGKGKEKVIEFVKNYVKACPVKEFIIDLEVSPFVECDASEESLKEFAEFAKLGKIPAASEIKEKYSKEWIDFMAYSWTKIGEVLKEGIRAGNPDAKLGVYSSYQSPENKARYSIDWNYWKNIADFAEMGYGRPPEKVRAETLDALKGIPVYFGLLFFQDTNPEYCYLLKNMILRRVSDGADGIMFYNAARLDGISFSRISEAMAILADYEEFFLKKNRIKEFTLTGDVTVDDVVILEAEGKKLVMVFNDSRKAKNGTVKIDDNEKAVSLNPWDVSIFTE